MYDWPEASPQTPLCTLSLAPVPLIIALLLQLCIRPMERRSVGVGSGLPVTESTPKTDSGLQLHEFFFNDYSTHAAKWHFCNYINYKWLLL